MVEQSDIDQLTEKVCSWTYHIFSIPLTPDLEGAQQFSSMALSWRLISSKIFKISILKGILQRVWRIIEAHLEVTYISRNTFLFYLSAKQPPIQRLGWAAVDRQWCTPGAESTGRC